MSKDFDYARQVLAAQPFSVLLGAELVSFSAQGVELRLPICESLKQQYGFVHGGVLGYLADNALTFAGGFHLRAQIVTSEFKINYVRPAKGDALLARATTINAGRTQAVARCEIFAQEAGVERLCAAAQGTITSLQPPTAAASMRTGVPV